jgi:imidazolonepropionase-like amidohydrolase
MHVHGSDNPAHWPVYIANGVVGVRDMFDRESPTEQREEAAAAPAAPEFYLAGPIIDGPPGYWDGSDLAGDANSAAEIVERQAAAGYDFVKVYELLSKEAYVAVLEEASSLGLTAAGHISGSMTLIEASDLGLRSVEHMDDVAVSCSADEAALRKMDSTDFFESLNQAIQAYATFDRSKCEALARQLISNDTWLVPTLAVMEAGAEAEHPSPRAVSYSRYLDAESADRILADEPIAEDELRILQEDFDINLELTNFLHAAGARILAGTDTLNPNVFPGFSLHDELKLLVRAGLSELDALRTATINPARFLGRERDFGNVEAGLAADIVLLDANPLDDIRNTTAIFAVVLDGELLTRSELDQLLESNRKLN